MVIALNMIERGQKKRGQDRQQKALAGARLPGGGDQRAERRQTDELSNTAVELAKAGRKSFFSRRFSTPVESALAKIRELIKNYVPAKNLRWYAIKFFERDEIVQKQTDIPKRAKEQIERIILECEREFDENSASIIIRESYDFVSDVVKACVRKTRSGINISDRIDSVVTSRWLGFPIFVAVMFFVYFVSVSTVGALVTEFTNEMFVGSFVQEPLRNLLSSAGTAEWLTGLVVDGIIGGIGSIAGFLPQMLILFFFLALLEDCGYMARIAFMMDRIFRKFGMSGKSFIPLLIGTGCGVPGIMAARTIEQQKDRRMTIMTTTFMPCGRQSCRLSRCLRARLSAAHGGWRLRHTSAGWAR